MLRSVTHTRTLCARTLPAELRLVTLGTRRYTQYAVVGAAGRALRSAETLALRIEGDEDEELKIRNLNAPSPPPPYPLPPGRPSAGSQ